MFIVLFRHAQSHWQSTAAFNTV